MKEGPAGNTISKRRKLGVRGLFGFPSGVCVSRLVETKPRAAPSRKPRIPEL